MAIATTARLGFPLLTAGQAQKEIAHNEALALADMLVQPVAESLGRNDPPSAPLAGQAWIVGAAPTGRWTARARAIAAWTEGGWRFYPARDGLHLFVRDTAMWAHFSAGAWHSGVLDAQVLRIDGTPVIGARQGAIPAPSGGTVVDGEARAAIAAILAAIRTHGLISP